MKMGILIIVIPLAFFCWIATVSGASAAPNLDPAYGHIPLAFTVNEGQAPSPIRFTAQGSGCGLAFSSTGTTFLLSRETPASVARRAAKRSVVFEDNPNRDRPEYEHFALKLAFVNANENPEILGEERLPWNNNYFIGNDPDKWRTDVPNYKKIRFKEVYRGIDLVYYGNQKRVKYDFVVKPGEDPERILLKYDFGEAGGSLAVNEKDELVVTTPVGNLVEEKPYCYQKVGGKEVGVEVKYEVGEGGTYRFRVGEYDRGYDLVIDPEVVYSTYLGGEGDDSVYDLAVDNTGNAYVVGKSGYKFPTTPGAFDTTQGTIFVSKISPDGTKLLYSTFLGELAHFLAFISVDRDGNAFVTGVCGELGFPTTPNAYDTRSELGKGFIIKLNPQGNALVYSTAFGGTHSNTVMKAIVINEAGEAYVTGYTNSAYFPTTPGAYGREAQKGFMAFVAKLSSDGSGLVYSTLLKEGYYSLEIAIDSQGNALIAGQTANPNFPITPGAYVQPSKGNYEIFLTKFNADGSGLVYSTTFGGNANDVPTGIVIDALDNAYICGNTESLDFPTTPGAFQPVHNGDWRVGFVTKFHSDGSGLIYSTLIEGTEKYGGGYLSDMAIDEKNQIYITGQGNIKFFPTTSDRLYPEGGTLLVILGNNGSNLVHSSLWGDNASDGVAISLDNKGGLYLTGVTLSQSFPVTPGVFGDTLSYNEAEWFDVFVSKFHFDFYTDIVKTTREQPDSFRILSIYPNPFNPSTIVTFTLTTKNNAELIIFSANGQRIRTLVFERMNAGFHSVVWDGKDELGMTVSSGVYLARLKSGKAVRNAKMLLLK